MRAAIASSGSSLNSATSSPLPSRTTPDPGIVVATVVDVVDVVVLVVVVLVVVVLELVVELEVVGVVVVVVLVVLVDVVGVVVGLDDDDVGSIVVDGVVVPAVTIVVGVGSMSPVSATIPTMAKVTTAISTETDEHIALPRWHPLGRLIGRLAVGWKGWWEVRRPTRHSEGRSVPRSRRAAAGRREAVAAGSRRSSGPALNSLSGVGQVAAVSLAQHSAWLTPASGMPCQCRQRDRR